MSNSQGQKVDWGWLWGEGGGEVLVMGTELWQRRWKYSGDCGGISHTAQAMYLTSQISILKKG